MANTLLATAGLGRELDVQMIDPTRSTTRLASRENLNNRATREIRNRTEAVRVTERNTEITREQRIQRLTALGRARRFDTLREVIHTAQGELSGGGLLVNSLS